MTACHEEIPIPDAGDAARLAAAVDRHMLADVVFGAKDDLAVRQRIKTKVLRLAADDRCPADDRPGTYRHLPHELRMRHHLHSGGDLSWPVDDGVGADLGGGVDLSSCINDGGGMDHAAKKMPSMPQRANFLFATLLRWITSAAPHSGTRRGGRVVYGSSLENWRGVILTVGSNPTLSAVAKRKGRASHQAKPFSDGRSAAQPIPPSPPSQGTGVRQ